MFISSCQPSHFGVYLLLIDLHDLERFDKTKTKPVAYQ